MRTRPTVSVLMPVRNAEAYIALSVGSLLRQTMEDFELLVINDGSSDNTLSILKSLSDRRIHLLGDDKERGISVRLNEGLESASGRFIARMDADDVASPHRLARQAAYLCSHVDIDLVGSAAAYIDGGGRFIGTPREYPLSDFEIKCRLLTSNCLLHPAVMFRQRGNAFRYSERFHFAQDYELWMRMAAEKSYANLPDVLLLQRRHREAVSFEKRAEQKRLANIALQYYAREFAGVDLPESVAAALIDPADHAPLDQYALADVMDFLLSATLKVRDRLGVCDSASRSFVSQEVAFFAFRCLSSTLNSSGLLSTPRVAATLGRGLLQCGALAAVPASISRYLDRRRRLSRGGVALLSSLVALDWQLGAATGVCRL